MNELNLQNPRFYKRIGLLSQDLEYGVFFVTLELPIRESLLAIKANILYFDLITTDNFFSEKQIWYRSFKWDDSFTSFNCIYLFHESNKSTIYGSLDLDKIYNNE
jgi:hypothetical protein